MEIVAILVIAGLIALAVIVIAILLAELYSEKKEVSFMAEESKKLMQLLTEGKIDQQTYERLRIKLEREVTYRKELEHLEGLLLNKKIDQGTYERLKKELQEKYQESS